MTSATACGLLTVDLVDARDAETWLVGVPFLGAEEVPAACETIGVLTPRGDVRRATNTVLFGASASSGEARRALPDRVRVPEEAAPSRGSEEPVISRVAETGALTVGGSFRATGGLYL